ncbi:hypothetical protein MKEN_01441600 [Mycena kentingensis (nom. inval.)]|nr:hypothetical protein MKEN_01441600 [Mycena kentingensis (nom. inval.)]
MLNVSLELHLHQILTPLQSLLPPDLADQLDPYLVHPPPPTIPYPLLLAISQWTRTPAGDALLRGASLNPSSYTMVALLAGTTTSPERKFGTYIPEPSPEDVAAARKAERKAITSIVNALLSIFGSGFAAWWASDKVGWKYEWRVLFALGVAAVVAISEAVLYLIWDSRRTKDETRRKLKTSAKKRERLQPPIDPSRVEKAPAGLRQRTIPEKT